MKFIYQFHGSDNTVQSGVVCARSRDAAYGILRSRGIKPFKVDLAPGVLNRILGRGKRWLLIGFLSLALIAVLLAYRYGDREWEPSSAYVSLEEDAKVILASSTNGFNVAREQMKQLFRERFASLADSERERNEAMALYGRMVMQIDSAEDKSGAFGSNQIFQNPPLTGDRKL